MYLYKATRDPFLLSLGEDMLDSIEYSAKTPCGYATGKKHALKKYDQLTLNSKY